MKSPIETYLLNHTSRETELLRELVEVSENDLEHIDMICGPQVGQLLAILVRLGQARRILEIGTFTGYSAIWMADALPDCGELITLELNERYQSVSDLFFNRDPYRKKIRQIMGDATESINRLDGDFDLVFLDADKGRYPEYLQRLKPRLKAGGILVADNTLWGGSVVDPDDPKSRAVDEMNQMLRQDPDFRVVMLPLRDGLTIAQKNPNSQEGHSGF